MAFSSVDEDFYCADLSRQVDEPLPGTAVSADVWLLLEYDGPWRERATADNDLPAPVQDWLQAQITELAEMGHTDRLQFIKQPQRQSDDSHFFLALADPVRPRIYQFTVADYSDLLELEPLSLLAPQTDDHAHIRSQPLVLVCTNGKRDRCCARYGVEFYEAMAAELETAVWQTTHLGGHRFAPTVATFPDGSIYGRFAPADAPRLADAVRNQQLLLDHLRGRVGYDMVTQVADYYLRRENGRRYWADFRHVETEQQESGRWRVVFRSSDGYHTVFLAQEEPIPRRASCGSDKIKMVPQFRFVPNQV